MKISNAMVSFVGAVAVTVALSGCAADAGSDGVAGETTAERQDQLVGQMVASENTFVRTGVAEWVVYRAHHTERTTLVAADADGADVLRIEAELTPEMLTLSTSRGSLALNTSTGEVVEDTLPSEARQLLGLLAQDVDAAPTEYSIFSCAASTLAAFAAAASCGTGNVAACFTLPWLFCVNSQECGNDVC